METIQEVVNVITSKSAKRAAVNALVLFVGASTLLFFASIGSALFFQNFVPHQVLSSPVYLQYGSGNNPYGIVSLTSPSVKAAQDYDISVKLSLPPSPSNVERGNFMITLQLLDQDVDQKTPHDAAPVFDRGNVIFSSRRPTLMPYVDPVVSLATRVFFLFYHMLFPSARTCEMIVPLAERVSFARGSSLPASAYVEIESGQTLQTYQVSLSFTARLGGLRWLMHHYRLPMYIMFTFLFWVCEVIFMALVWSIFATPGPAAIEDADKDYRGRGGKTRLLTKSGDEDEEDLSDHPHNFPTYGKQPPLKHEPEVKDEEHERPLSEVPVAGAEADDEDDEDDEARGPHRDSGIGTSYSEEGSENVRRRGSRQGG